MLGLHVGPLGYTGYTREQGEILTSRLVARSCVVHGGFLITIRNMSRYGERAAMEYIQARSLNIGSGLLDEMPGRSVEFQTAVQRK